jgi:single-strand DNA-binding protein
MNDYKVKGLIKVIGETVQVTEKFSKREIVITVEDGKYPQHISLQATGDKTSLLDGYKVGEEVKASFNLRGREWQDKHFNSLELWEIDLLTPAAAVAPAHVPDNPADDLPF